MVLIRKILHNISVLINILFALLLLLSHISIYFSPEKYYLFAYFGLAFPYLLFINAVFIVYWAIKRRLQFLISLVAIFIGWGNIAAFVQLPFEPLAFLKNNHGEGAQLKVMSYNVRAFNRYRWKEGGNMLDDITNLIKSERPDVICFQEFFTVEGKGYSLDRIQKLLKPYKYYPVFSAYNSSRAIHFGVATFSKYPVIKYDRIVFRNTHNITIYTDIKVGDDTVRVYNCHLQSLRFIKGDYDLIDSMKLSYDEAQIAGIKKISVKIKDAYTMRAKQVDYISEHVAKAPYPSIVCGDFNDTPVSYTYHKMKGELKDAFRRSGKGLGNTYIGKFPSFRIDYIFYDKRFVSWDFKTLVVKMSDHYPIICNLAFKEK